MTAFIALYRGVNVGGRRPVAMEALRALHQSLGHAEVKSYVQSGNLVFRAGRDARAIADEAAAAFASSFGFSARVMVRSAAEWRRIVAGNPYAAEAKADPAKVHLAICEGTPDKAALSILLERSKGTERFATAPGAIYLHAPEGVGRSKFAAGMERASGVAATVRNWRTVLALMRMVEAIEG